MVSEAWLYITYRSENLPSGMSSKLPYSPFRYGQFKTRTADCGPGTKQGLGIKRGLNRKWGPILKIAVVTDKYQKMLPFQFSRALFSCRRSIKQV